MTPSDAMEERGRRVRRSDEEQLQRSIADYLRYAAPKAMWFAVPNGEHRSKATGGRLKAMGVRAGVPDLCFILKRGYAGFMELKVAGGKLSKPQEAFQAYCEENQIPYALVTSLDGAIKVFKGWGIINDRHR